MTGKILMFCPKGSTLRASLFREVYGEVSEWPKEHAWKVCKSKGFEGSNPSLSAINSLILQQKQPIA